MAVKSGFLEVEGPPEFGRDIGFFDADSGNDHLIAETGIGFYV